MTFVILPTGTLSETYFFELSEDGLLKCVLGKRKSNNIKQKGFMKTTENESSKIISKEDVQTLIKFADNLQSGDYISNKQMIKDSWDAILLYNDKVYEMSLWINDSDIFMELYNTIIKLSPIPMDLHGWA
jgi:hypothetical protein